MGRWSGGGGSEERARKRRAYQDYMDPIIDEAERIIRRRLLPHAEEINRAATETPLHPTAGQLSPEVLDRVLEDIDYKINFRRRKLRTYATAHWMRREVRFNHLFVQAARQGTDLFSEMNMEGRERFAFLLDTVIHEVTHILQPLFLGTRSGHGKDWRWIAGLCGAVPIGCTSWRKRLRGVRKLLREEGLEGKEAAIVEPAPSPTERRENRTDGRTFSSSRGLAGSLRDVMLTYGPPEEWSTDLANELQDWVGREYPRHRVANEEGVRAYARVVFKDGRDYYRKNGACGTRGNWWADMCLTWDLSIY